jgi:hypothetical protein
MRSTRSMTKAQSTALPPADAQVAAAQPAAPPATASPSADPQTTAVQPVDQTPVATPPTPSQPSFSSAPPPIDDLEPRTSSNPIPQTETAPVPTRPDNRDIRTRSPRPKEVHVHVADFRGGGQSSPGTTPAWTGAAALLWAQPTTTHLPEHVRDALTKSTRNRHVNLLLLLRAKAAELPRWAEHTPLSTFASTILLGQRTWRFSTKKNAMGALQSALLRLPQYVQGATAIDLSSDTDWQDAMRWTSQRANNERPRTPIAAKFCEVQLTVERLQKQGKRDLAMLVILAWCHAARPGCTLQLHASDLVFFEDQDLTARITWRRGKGVAFRGPYTTWSTLGDWQAWVQLHLPASGPIFPTVRTEKDRTKMVAALLKELRVTSPMLECRSLRRGSLQTLAHQGVSSELLMIFSGHRSIHTLYRYLGWGAEHHLHRAEAVHAAGALHGIPESLLRNITTTGAALPVESSA